MAPTGLEAQLNDLRERHRALKAQVDASGGHDEAAYAEMKAVYQEYLRVKKQLDAQKAGGNEPGPRGMMPVMNTAFRYLVVASPLHDDRAQDAIAAAHRRTLTAAGGTPAVADDWANPSPLVYVILTGGTEQEVLRLRALRSAAWPDEPVLLLAHPGHNSLPAALEILARSTRTGKPVDRVPGCLPRHGRPDSLRKPFAPPTTSFLRSARIGVIGHPSDWLVASALPSVAQTLGPHPGGDPHGDR